MEEKLQLKLKEEAGEPSFQVNGREADRFLSNLADKFSLKEDTSYGETVAWLRTKLSFCLLTLTHIRGGAQSATLFLYRK